ATSPPEPGETILFADGNPLATTTACNTCHSDGGAYNGAGVKDPVFQNPNPFQGAGFVLFFGN
ncbi:MAG: hypothetical protein SV487_07445, partial [Thermodesulfobacteriota bacterium]|nr:hypothetical protein [Thermodesulfobacteriota bacterium]